MMNDLYRKTDGKEFTCTESIIGADESITLTFKANDGEKYENVDLKEVKRDYIHISDIEQYVKELEEWKLSNEKEEVKFKYEVGQELVGKESNAFAKITHRGTYFNSNVNYYQIKYEDGISIEIDEDEVFGMFVLIGEEPSKKLKHSGGYAGEFKKSVADEVELKFNQSAVSSNINVNIDKFPTTEELIERMEKLGEVNKKKEESQDELGRFEKIAEEIGSFTQMKNEQYGSSVDAAYEIMKVLMERYKTEDGTYNFPEELLQDLLLQVRLLDKINRVFNLQETYEDKVEVYKDITGYGLIGIDMVNRTFNK